MKFMKRANRLEYATIAIRFYVPREAMDFVLEHTDMNRTQATAWLREHAPDLTGIDTIIVDEEGNMFASDPMEYRDDRYTAYDGPQFHRGP